MTFSDDVDPASREPVKRCPRCERPWWDQGYCDHYFHVEGRDRQREKE